MNHEKQNMCKYVHIFICHASLVLSKNAEWSSCKLVQPFASPGAPGGAVEGLIK